MHNVVIMNIDLLQLLVSFSCTSLQKPVRNGTGEANMRHDVHADKHARAASLAHTVGGEGWGGG